MSIHHKRKPLIAPETWAEVRDAEGGWVVVASNVSASWCSQLCTMLRKRRAVPDGHWRYRIKTTPGASSVELQMRWLGIEENLFVNDSGRGRPVIQHAPRSITAAKQEEHYKLWADPEGELDLDGGAA
jgi:hypothetical protein